MLGSTFWLYDYFWDFCLDAQVDLDPLMLFSLFFCCGGGAEEGKQIFLLEPSISFQRQQVPCWDSWLQWDPGVSQYLVWGRFTGESSLWLLKWQQLAQSLNRFLTGAFKCLIHLLKECEIYFSEKDIHSTWCDLLENNKQSFLFSYFLCYFLFFFFPRRKKPTLNVENIIGLQVSTGESDQRSPGFLTALTFAFFEHLPKQSTDSEPSCHSGCPGVTVLLACHRPILAWDLT